MIRKYEDRDLPALLEVWYEASLLAHPFLTAAFLDQERENIQRIYMPRAETWVFEDAGAVIGFVAMLDDEVGALFVSPARQRKGVGRALLDHVREPRDQLELEVFKANPIGRAFYDTYGFRMIAERIHEETGQPLLRMRLDG